MMLSGSSLPIGGAGTGLHCHTQILAYHAGKFEDYGAGSEKEAAPIFYPHLSGRNGSQYCALWYWLSETHKQTAEFPVERLHYVGTDMATHYMRETVEAMPRELFDLYLAYHFSICERQDMVEAHHILDILRKNLA